MSRDVDSVDVLAVMTAFEEINQCRIVVELFTQRTPRAGVLQVKLAAWDAIAPLSDQLLLGSHQLTYGYFNPMTLDQVILNGLYTLDAVIDANNPARARNK